MNCRKCTNTTTAIRRAWMVLMLLLFYTILMVITLSALTLTMTENNKTRSQLLLLEDNNQQMKKERTKEPNKKDNLIKLNLTRFGNRLQLRQRERQPRVYTFSGGEWKSSDICKPLTTYINENNFYLTTANSEAGSVKIYVHNPKYDAISGTIKQRRSFESENVDTVISMLRKEPELSLIDIGSNVGIHALSAALLGRQVLAIDAGIENIHHICASVEYNNFINNVALVYNALSDFHGTVKFRHGIEGDFGLAHVDADGIASKMDSKFKNYFKNSVTKEVPASTMDDLLSLPRLTFFKKILIKMDVEGHEHRVLLGAKEFMKKKMNLIKGIFMEWQWFSGREAEDIIKGLMSGWNFEPYSFFSKFEILNVNKTDNWPKDILWLPKVKVDNENYRNTYRRKHK